MCLLFPALAASHALLPHCIVHPNVQFYYMPAPPFSSIVWPPERRNALPNKRIPIHPQPSRPLHPIPLPSNLRNLLKLTPIFTREYLIILRIQAQRSPHRMLRLCRAVEAQDEVVAGVVVAPCLRAVGREQEGAPVGDAADDAAGGEDDVAGWVISGKQAMEVL